MSSLHLSFTMFDFENNIILDLMNFVEIEFHLVWFTNKSVRTIGKGQVSIKSFPDYGFKEQLDGKWLPCLYLKAWTFVSFDRYAKVVVWKWMKWEIIIRKEKIMD